MQLRSSFPWLLSLLLHCLLAFLFLAIRLRIHEQIPERLTEIALLPAYTMPKAKTKPVAIPQPQPTTTQTPAQLPQTIHSEGETEISASQPSSRIVSSSNLAPTTIPSPQSKIPTQVSEIVTSDLPNQATTSLVSKGISDDTEEIGSLLQQLENSNAKTLFHIEGELENRKLLHSPLPEFPVNVQEEATIKMQITVGSTGKIIESIPLQKGHIAFMENVEQALKQWLFAPANAHLQTGVITFEFQLQ